MLSTISGTSVKQESSKPTIA
eukprot:COSAG02_NODE_46156_length_351_cov_0.825397_1_plen_20_part_01